MKVFIPTRGRIDRQRTWSHLPAKLRKHTSLVVQRWEANQYPSDLPLIVLPDTIKTIAPTRQWIIDNCVKHSEKFVMLDDDLHFNKRDWRDPNKFTAYPQSDKDTIDMFDLIEAKLDRFAHVGVLSREGGNTVMERSLMAARMVRVLAYRSDILWDNNVRFDRLPLQEDFDVTLQLLRKGYPNHVICDYIQGQGTSGDKGGCSHFRTLELHNSNAEKLAALHPGFVKVVEKTTKSAWGGATRKDVVVYWKSALRSAANANK